MNHNLIMILRVIRPNLKKKMKSKASDSSLFIHHFFQVNTDIQSYSELNHFLCHPTDFRSFRQTWRRVNESG